MNVLVCLALIGCILLIVFVGLAMICICVQLGKISEQFEKLIAALEKNGKYT